LVAIHSLHRDFSLGPSAEGVAQHQGPLPALARQVQQAGDDFAVAHLGMSPEFGDAYAPMPFTNRDGARVDTSTMREGMEEIFVKRLAPIVTEIYQQNLQALAEEQLPASEAEWEQVRDQAWRQTMSQKDVAPLVDRLLDEGAELVAEA
jgi:hypothetical protein